MSSSRYLSQDDLLTSSLRSHRKSTAPAESIRFRVILLILLGGLLLLWCGVAGWNLLADYQQSLTMLQDELRIQTRTEYHHRQSHLEELRTDPRAAFKLAEELRGFASHSNLSTKPLDRILENVPCPRSLPAGTTLRIHETRFQPPAWSVELSVSDAQGTFLPNLTRADFEVWQGSRRLTQIQVATDQRVVQPLSALLLLDASRSMAGVPLTSSQEAARSLAVTFQSPHRLQIGKFSDQVTWLTPWTFDSEVLREAIDAVAIENGTALAAALRQAIPVLAQRPGDRHLIVLTDGEDSFRPLTPTEFIDLSQPARIRIHFVSLVPGGVSHELLRNIAQATGGSCHPVSEARELVSVFQTLHRSLQQPIYRLVVLDPLDSGVPLTLRMDGLPELSIPFVTPQPSIPNSHTYRP